MKRFTLWAAALVACLLTFGRLTSLPARSDDSVRPVVKAQGNPLLVDFIASLSKRADLRISAARKGLDAAFTDWLKVERPNTYTARKSSVTAVAVQNAHDGQKASCCTRGASCCAKSPSASCCGTSCCGDACCSSACCNSAGGK